MCESVTILKGGRVLHVPSSHLRDFQLRGGEVMDYAAEVRTYENLFEGMLMPRGSVNYINTAERRGKRTVKVERSLSIL